MFISPSKLKKYLLNIGIEGEIKLLKDNLRDSIVYKSSDKIIKIWKQSNFELGALHDKNKIIYNILAQYNISPLLLNQIFLEEEYLVGIFEFLKSSSTPLNFKNVGKTLALAHLYLENIKPSRGLPWLGFYGEYNEFKLLIPSIDDEEISRLALKILPFAQIKHYTSPAHYIHRDLNPSNVIINQKNTILIDWDMAYFGYREDDVAMSICCLLDNVDSSMRQVEAAKMFLEGYREIIPAEWGYLNSPQFNASLALAGLRQAVAGWFSDQGNTTQYYWKNIRHRLMTSHNLIFKGE